jgi:cardiolipin synthase
MTEDLSEKKIGPVWFNRYPMKDPFEGKKGENMWATGPTGSLHDRIIEIIRSAEDVLCLSSFLFSDKRTEDALMEVAEYGVRVYLLSAYEIRFGQASAQDSVHLQRMLEESKATLNRLAGRVLVRTAEHLHAKMIISDPKDEENGRGLLLTSNLTTDALTRNPELGVEVPFSLVKDMHSQFCRGFWLESKRELIEPGQLRAVQDSAIDGLESPSDLLVTDSQNHTLREELLGQIESSKGDILISCYGFDPNHPVAKALIEATKKGRNVTVISRPRPVPRTMETLLALANAGASVLGHPWLHAKAVVTQSDDGYEGTLMTANIEERGLDTGFEMGARLTGDDAESLREVLLNWTSAFPQELILDGKIGELGSEIRLWRDGELIDMEIGEKYAKDLGNIVAPSIDEMETVRPSNFPEPNVQNTLYREHVYTWTVLPPRLPKKARPEKEKHPLPVYRHGKKTYVAIQKKNQLKQGRKLAEELNAMIVVSKAPKEPAEDPKA